MKLQFKNQKFQEDAAKAVCDVFKGQPKFTSNYLIDQGSGANQGKAVDDIYDVGWKNYPIIPRLTENIILDNIRDIQLANDIKPSDSLKGKYNITIEMETGVGKTYTYIKTMYELNKAYGWSKFIVVVPSIAIREGVYKTFQVTQDHFVAEYGKRIQFFIYNSKDLTSIEQFPNDNNIKVMIINSQAFNAKGKDARRIYMRLDSFKSRKPIDVIAKTNPILIIDEPQSVEGPQTKERLKEFNPLMTLRYSATHKKDSVYNMVYQLDAVKAYNEKLVKKIRVKGITQSGITGANGYVYLESINLSDQNPTATIRFDIKNKNGVGQTTRIVSTGFNLYDHSNQMEEYKNNYVVSTIDGRDEYISFSNGIKLYKGDIVGDINEDVLREVQIRETIKSHLENEEKLFEKGIKVLSLFFIDEVSKYKQYDAAGQSFNGTYAQSFEEIYKEEVNEEKKRLDDKIKNGEKHLIAYKDYLDSISEHETHAGYFSIDKGRMVNSKVGKRETTTDDVDAYDLIMKNKELLLDLNPKHSPVRFIFSHSALREGWDNPNVFQICTLKQSSSDVRKRQEVGRGLRLCVNKDGMRMDENVLDKDVHEVNALTVIASESYDSFARSLQNELAEVLADRPQSVTNKLFVGKCYTDANGKVNTINENMARVIHNCLVLAGYIDIEDKLTKKYFDDKKNDSLSWDNKIVEYSEVIVKTLDSVYTSGQIPIEDARSNVEVKLDNNKLNSKEFIELWNLINKKTSYTVDFDSQELIKNSIEALDAKLTVSKIKLQVVSGEMGTDVQAEQIKAGLAFKRIKEDHAGDDYDSMLDIGSKVKYDLIGKLVEETGLTRKDIVGILTGIKKETFDLFKLNPEDFIIKVGRLINEQKAATIIAHIKYNKLNDEFDLDIFADGCKKGKLGKDVIKVEKNIYDHLAFDSKVECSFAQELDVKSEVAVYAKLPSKFIISTPVGKYNPDWAIAFKDGSVKHIYFIAETKGNMMSMQLKKIEEDKEKCAQEHFKAISGDKVVCHIVSTFDQMLGFADK